MTEQPVDLDGRRDAAAREAAQVRRQHLLEFRAEQTAMCRRQEELEALLQAAPAEVWQEVVVKAQYLIQLFADTPEGRDPRRKTLIAQTLDDLNRLCQSDKEWR